MNNAAWTDGFITAREDADAPTPSSLVRPGLGGWFGLHSHALCPTSPIAQLCRDPAAPHAHGHLDGCCPDHSVRFTLTANSRARTRRGDPADAGHPCRAGRIPCLVEDLRMAARSPRPDLPGLSAPGRGVLAHLRPRQR